MHTPGRRGRMSSAGRPDQLPCPGRYFLRRGLKGIFYNPDLVTEEMVELDYQYLRMPGAKETMLNIIRNNSDLIDWAKTNEKKSINYNILDYSIVEFRMKNIKNFEIPIFNVLNPEDSQKMTDYIVDKLAEYAHIEAF